MNLFEAFDALKKLDEETFNIDSEGVKKLSEFQNDDLDELSVYNIETDTDEEAEDFDYNGSVITECNVCHSKIFKNKDDIKLNEDHTACNEGEECPYCFSPDGYKIIGEVKEYEDSDKVEEETLEEGIKTPKPKYTIEVDPEYESEDQEIDFNDDNTITISRLADMYGIDDSSIGDIIELKIKDDTGNVKDDWLTYVVKIKNVEEVFLDDVEYPDYYPDTVTFEIVEDKSKYYEESLSEGCKGKKKEIKEDLGTDIDKYQKWVDYDMKKYGKISKKTENEVKKAGLSITKDQYGEYEVIGKEPVKESLNESNNNEAGEYTIAWYHPIATIERRYETVDDVEKGWHEVTNHYDSKADALRDAADMIDLYWYDDEEDLDAVASDEEAIESILGSLNDGVDWGDGSDFILFIKGPDGKYIYDGGYHTKQEYIDEFVEEDEDIDESLNEDLKKVSVETEDTEINVEGTEDGEVNVNTRPIKKSEEDLVIEPVDEETKEEIERNSEEDEYEEEDEVDIDIDTFDEESFDELGESYLKESYNNVKGFGTKKVYTKGNKLFIEGIITFDTNNEKRTKFVFESYNIDKDNGKLYFIGGNKQINGNKKPCILEGKLRKGKLIVESLKNK